MGVVGGASWKSRVLLGLCCNRLRDRTCCREEPAISELRKRRRVAGRIWVRCAQSSARPGWYFTRAYARSVSLRTGFEDVLRYRQHLGAIYAAAARACINGHQEAAGSGRLLRREPHRTSAGQGPREG